ncbi:pentatricopeptide repeat-containing protein At5g39350 [Tripterygium wilfordii]|uniref:pentatricopeptide repeat-containing protein At5g39350 n=1 Tax=Tripterygium wilfordii TaxID=458696 RepID=UPI0018F84BD4|nr:pentatricopeptide repeat-containing protein At5g39350 [Tripterygium wilfordii]
MNGPSRALFKTGKHRTTTTTSYQCQSLLRHCAATRSLARTKQVHAHTITSGLLSGNNATYLPSNVAATYALCGNISFARKMFDELRHRTLFLYNTMIRLYVSSGFYCEAIKVFFEMIGSRDCVPDGYAYVYTIKACSDLKFVKMGVLVHGQTLVGGFGSDTFVQNSLMAMYMNCRQTEMARKVFDKMAERSVVSWNSMINGYFKNGYAEEALRIYNLMEDEGIDPDCSTVVSVLPICGYLKLVEVGRKVHALVEEKGLWEKITARNALVDMYVKCGCMGEARLVFDSKVERDVVTWTSMINGHILNDDMRSALELCRMMQFEGVKPNSATLASLLSACTSLQFFKDARCLHGWSVRHKIEHEVTVETALIDMYAKCNRVDLSFQVFSKSTRKKIVPWNALLAGCTHKGLTREAIELFKQMLKEELEPDDATLNGLIPAYGTLANLQQTDNIHCYLIRSGFLSIIEVATGLIDAYSKCGNLDSAHKIFEGIPEKLKDVFVWSVIIAGYGMHGHGETAVSLFEQMIKSGVKPNEVTFTSLLHACSHAGLVDEGLALFKFMLEDNQKSTNDNHYTCIVDLLGRTGRLDEAYGLIRAMPFQPSPTVWGALLGACAIHENAELGEVAAKCLFELEPENTGNYILMAKIYSATGRWREAEKVRRMMNEIGLRKELAHSLIEVRNT